ncbi:MAG: hypothetical protein L0Y72_04915 [Gemmataceae bacterium]|nr:hypothetical protein [Gemmataceae bacterium]MCI0738363.1 hypothetical protein [Gemmataceae bacterium]
MQAKSSVPALQQSWDNFLLGCVYCNSIKGKKQVNLALFLWPDRDNTFRAFKYERDRCPQVADHWPANQRDLPTNTLGLTGLDREPGHPNLSPRDRRWLKRREAWEKASRARQNWESNATAALENQIIDTATSTGFWSVWIRVFADIQQISRRLISNQTFPGTCQTCFSELCQPIPRPGGMS